MASLDEVRGGRDDGTDHGSRLDKLIGLSRELGRPELDLVILAEGNASAQIGPGEFAVKATGKSMEHSVGGDFVGLRWEPLVAALRDERTRPSDVPGLFRDARLAGGSERQPSTETFLHAVGYGLCSARYVAHTHPTHATALLSSIIEDRELREVLFPDQAIVCGPEVAIVPYADPGLELGRLLVAEVDRHQGIHGESPRIVLLRNHGIVAFGDTPEAVLAGTRMAAKAARVRIAAAAVGGTRPLSPDVARRLANRPDEVARLAQLFGA